MAIDWTRLITVRDGDDVNIIAGKHTLYLSQAEGRGITSIEKTSTAGLVDTYTIYYSDGSTSTFQVTNGKDASEAGLDGRGIDDIQKTGTAGLVDTYTIYYSDGTTSTYDVTNGKDGIDGSGVEIDTIELVKDTDYRSQLKIVDTDENEFPFDVPKMIDANIDEEYDSYTIQQTVSPYEKFDYLKWLSYDGSAEFSENELIAHFPVTQTGSGEPSATNIRPFVGVSEIEFSRVHWHNMLPTLDTSNHISTYFTFRTASDGSFCLEKLDTTIQTDTWENDFRYKMILPAGNYKFSGGSYVSGTTIYIKSRLKNDKTGTIIDTDTGSGFTFSLTEDTPVTMMFDLYYLSSESFPWNIYMFPYLRNVDSVYSEETFKNIEGYYWKGNIKSSGFQTGTVSFLPELDDEDLNDHDPIYTIYKRSEGDNLGGFNLHLVGDISDRQNDEENDAFHYLVSLHRGSYFLSGGARKSGEGAYRFDNCYIRMRVINPNTSATLGIDIGQGCIFTLPEDMMVKIQVDLDHKGSGAFPWETDIIPTLVYKNMRIYGGDIDIVSGKMYEEWGYIPYYTAEDESKLIGMWYSDRDVYAKGVTPTIGAEVVYHHEEPIMYSRGSWSYGTFPLKYGDNVYAFHFDFSGQVTFLKRRIAPMTLRQYIDRNVGAVIVEVSKIKSDDYKEFFQIIDDKGKQYPFEVSRMIDANNDAPYQRHGLRQLISPFYQYYYTKVVNNLDPENYGEGGLVVKYPVTQAGSGTPSADNHRAFVGVSTAEFMSNYVSQACNALTELDTSGTHIGYSIVVTSDGAFYLRNTGAVASNTDLDAFRSKFVLPAGSYHLAGGAYVGRIGPTNYIRVRVKDSITGNILATDTGSGCTFTIEADTLITVMFDLFELSSSAFPWMTNLFPYLHPASAPDYGAGDPLGQYYSGYIAAQISGVYKLYGGNIDIVAGKIYEEWGYISSYAATDAPKLKGMWYSDRDVYVKGTLPTVGAEVVYHREDPIIKTAAWGNLFSGLKLRGGTNVFAMHFDIGSFGVGDIEILKRKVQTMTMRQYIDLHPLKTEFELFKEVANESYAPAVHDHDELYYRKEHVDTELSEKADAVLVLGDAVKTGKEINLSANATVSGIKLKFELTQEGTGDPSPSNIRPFVGISAMSLKVAIGDQNVSLNYYMPYDFPVLVDGEYDVLTGYLTTDYGYIQSFDPNEHFIEGVWYSDRDVYAAGTLPSTGAEVVYELYETKTIEAYALAYLADTFTVPTTWRLTKDQGSTELIDLGEIELVVSEYTPKPIDQYVAGIVAEAFSSTKAYAVGDYAVYNGGLYRFTSAHSAGAWDADDVAQTTIMAEIVRLTS